MKNKYVYLVNFMLDDGEGMATVTCDNDVNSEKRLKNLQETLKRANNGQRSSIKNLVLLNSKKTGKRKFI